MRLRLASAAGLVIATLLGALALAGPAQANSMAGKAEKADKKAKATCAKVGKAKGAAKAKARKSCSKAKADARKAWGRASAGYFDVCKKGCKNRTVFEGALAAGKWQKRTGETATVRVQPGVYNEGVFLWSAREGTDFDGLTIMGVTKAKKPNSNARAVILDGTDAKTIVKGNPNWQEGDPASVPANNAIEARGISGIVLKNMWARNYANNTFFVHASNVEADGETCDGYTMDNLASSNAGSYGLFARNCYGGKMLNSEGWNHGDSAIYIGETPCDTEDWNNKTPGGTPCQANPKWTLVSGIKSHQGSLGYSGTNSKYVKIKDSAFFNNGAGLVPNTLDSEKYEPSGDLIFENNKIFWNNLNYYSTGSPIQTAIGNGNPTGAGILLYGTDGVIVRNNEIFGNEKWGVASFSGPELFGVNDGDDARNMNNQLINNKMGRNGVDPNAIDFFNDNSGGGNCWQGNTASGGVTFAPGNGSKTLSEIYPTCPQATVEWVDVLSVDLFTGLQANASLQYFEDYPWKDLTTIFGAAEIRPSKLQECAWDVQTPHPAYPGFTEVRADPVSQADCDDLYNRNSSSYVYVPGPAGNNRVYSGKEAGFNQPQLPPRN